MAIVHQPVLLEEVLSFLLPPRADSLMLDATLGEGGHAEAFLRKYPSLRYLGLDADPAIQAEARERLSAFAPRVAFRLGFFDELIPALQAEAEEGRAERPDLVLFDLGISMHHYLESGRGFGFAKAEALDMRLDPSSSPSAADIVRDESEEDIARIIFEYGEERLSRRIARAIVEARSHSAIATTADLAAIIESAVPAAYRHGRIHPATRTFQALRIATNDELGRARRGIRAACALLAPGGIIGVISFHSLEDRIVKNIFRDLAGRSTQRPDEPIQVVSGPVEFELLVKKPLEAGPAEAGRNPASRSAKLRVARRLAGGPAGVSA